METVKNVNGIRYREKIYQNGKVISKTFIRKTDAIQWKRKALLDRDVNENLGLPTIQDITLKDFSDIWILNNTHLAPRSLDSYKSALKQYLIPNFGHLNLKSIKVQHGHGLITILQKKNLSIPRINFLMVFFKHLLADAIKWDYLILQPFKNIKKFKEIRQKELYWLPYEINQFLNAIKDNEFYELYVIALNTGMRRGELLGLKWDKVDFKNRQIEVSRSRDRYGIKENTKTGKVIFVPMNDVTLKTLLSLKDQKRSLDLVFVGLDGLAPDLEHVSDRLFKKCIDLAGVKRIKFHNLRSSFAANFCMNGGDVYTLSKMLGHSTVEMTSKKYAHLHPSYLQKASHIVSFGADVNSDSPFLARDHLKVVQSV